MFARLIPGLTNAAERGWLPDSLLRVGIRRLVAQRLKEESEGNCEDWQIRLQQFVDDASAGPIAPVPEKANEQHYEVPAEFFAKVLGRRLKYSCCYWPEGVDTLSQAEVAALEATCRRADIHDGMHVLDLGCGWGSASLWIAEHYPNCRITSVSNSASQRAFIEQQAAEAGFRNLRVITADMNDFQAEATFDRVLSVEMFEHMRNHRELLRRISTWLNPGGKLFVHVFCHRLFTYPFQASGSEDWMAQHFFTGGIMPGDDLLVRYQDDLKLTKQWRWSGQHYQRTAESWLQNLDRHTKSLRALFQETYGRSDGDRWIHRWRLFFLACAELFGYRQGQEWWVSHYRFERP
jgi:cyclopropane-fatty-acyl-phospholipid synthase